MIHQPWTGELLWRYCPIQSTSRLLNYCIAYSISILGLVVRIHDEREIVLYGHSIFQQLLYLIRWYIESFGDRLGIPRIPAIQDVGTAEAASTYPEPEPHTEVNSVPSRCAGSQSLAKDKTYGSRGAAHHTTPPP